MAGKRSDRTRGEKGWEREVDKKVANRGKEKSCGNIVKKGRERDGHIKLQLDRNKLKPIICRGPWKTT